MYWLTGVLGLALFFAPFALGYSSDTTAFWSNIVLGAAVVVISGIKALMQDGSRWEYWTAGLLGLAMIVAPFVLNYATVAVALWASIFVGAVIAVLSGYKIFSGSPQGNK